MPAQDELHGDSRAAGQPTLEDGLGPRLRTRREARGLSQRELARRLDLSPSAISQFETGKSRVSVSTLYAIVSELEVSLDELFSGLNGERRAPDPPARTLAASIATNQEEKHVQRAETRKSIELETGVTWERLTASADPDVDFIYLVYAPGGSSARDDQAVVHAGREYGLVLSGTLELTVGFDTYALGSGDSISFDSTVPHRLCNSGVEPAHAVWFTARPVGTVSNGGGR